MDEAKRVIPYVLEPRPHLEMYWNKLMAIAGRMAAVSPVFAWCVSRPVSASLVLTFIGTMCFVRVYAGPTGTMPSLSTICTVWVWLFSLILLLAVVVMVIFLSLILLPHLLLLFREIRLSWERWFEHTH